ncbi:MAG: M23 family metallopeptidase [Acetatifactor sp.]|nr:M23 family metallopeptidase [Acetatifactor sp.]
MGRRRHKRKNSHVVIVTSDAVDATTRHFRIRSWIVETFVILLCIVVGAAIGYILFLQDLRVGEAGQVQIVQQQEIIEGLEEENAALQSQIAELNSTVQILSNTVTQKTESEGLLAQQLEQQSIPTELPLKGKATFEETPEEGDPMCIITVSSGGMVVAAASGTVSAVNDDGEYGHNVWVDHGNGYVTIYRNQGEIKVKQGETVRQGSTLILINEENNRLVYQMMKDGAYIDPMDVLAING